MAGNPNLTLTVYVSGVKKTVTVNPKQKVEQLIREALKEAKVPEPYDLSEWNLRFEKEGEPIPHDEGITKAGIDKDSILFLDADAGGGGSYLR